MRVVLTLTVDYDECEYEDASAAAVAAKQQLTAAADHLADVGLLTGETALYLDDYKVVVK